ncbi:MAG: DMT family transporter [Paracoccaceae bacterium]|nr:DMT family transporter [Paracoccaceae bacterium]
MAPSSGATAAYGRAALWMGGAMAGFVSMALAGREVARWHDTFEIMTWRSVVGVVIVLSAARISGQWHALRARNMGLHLIRNLSHFTGQNLWFAALTLIPLAQLFALEFSYPILVALAAPLVLGEQLTRRSLTAAGLGFSGILLVAHPWDQGGFSFGTVLAMLAAVGFAGSALCTKRLTRTAPVIEILLWLTVMQTGFGAVMMLGDGAWHWPSVQSAPWLALIGVAGLGAHFCMTRALALAPASVVIPIDFLRLPLIAALGAIFYQESVSIGVFAGGVVILWANWINLRARPGTPQPLPLDET